MDSSLRRFRLLLIAALVIMVVAVIDPLEGSIVILAGAVVAAFAAIKLNSPHRGAACAGAALLAVGVGAMWGLSAVGGFGGDTGRSNLWWFALVPYPIGWIVSLMSAARSVRDGSDRGAAQAG
jgi:hypothetical protein